MSAYGQAETGDSVTHCVGRGFDIRESLLLKTGGETFLELERYETSFPY